MSESTEIVIPEKAETESIADLVRRILIQLGEDPNREGLRRTPERYEKALRFLTGGYRQDPDKLLNGAMFNVCYDEMVVVKDIEVYSLCEHHLLPFFGHCHVAYIPSKSGRAEQNCPPREYVRAALADSGAIDESDRERDPGKAQPGRRGSDPGSAASLHGDARRRKTTIHRHHQHMLGVFRESKQTRDEFLSLVRNRKP